MQVKDPQLMEPGFPLQQHSNHMLPQEATATCDQVYQLLGLHRVCHVLLGRDTGSPELPAATCLSTGSHLLLGL